MVTKNLTIEERHLSKPVSRVARLMMRRRLAMAESLVDELANPDALHQFRVAVRRARSIEKAYRPYLADVVSRKLRQRLKAVVAATGAARDTEVQLERLAERRIDPRPHQEPGFDWLQQRLQQRLAAEYAQLQDNLAERFLLVHKPLRERLKSKRVAVQLSFAEVTAGLLLEAAGDFALQCEPIGHEMAEEPLHSARIAGKRLRYLLEPLVDVFPDARGLVKTLKGLQDLLGEIHDLQVFGHELMLASEEAGAARMRKLIELSLTLSRDAPELVQARERDERAGLMSLARQLQARQMDLHEYMRARLRAGDVEELVAGVQALSRECSRAGLHGRS